jgi:transposase
MNFEAFGVPVMYLAPYSFKMAAVEKLFAFVKNRDLNPLVAKSYSRYVFLVQFFYVGPRLKCTSKKSPSICAGWITPGSGTLSGTL